MLTYFPISAIINFLTASVIAVFVYFRGKRNQVNRSFTYSLICVAVYSFAYFFWQISKTEQTALFWSRALMAGAIFIPVAFLDFVANFLGQREKQKKIIIIGYFQGIIFLLLDFTNFYIQKVKPEMAFSFWPKPGPAFHLFLFIWFFYFLYFCYLLYSVYRKTAGIKRAQIGYLLLGSIIGFLGGSTNYFLWYGIKIPPYGNILISVYVLCVFYAITRYRLFNIRLTVSRGLYTALIAAFVYAAFYVVAWLENWLFGSIFQPRALVFGIFLAILFVLLFNSWQKIIRLWQKKKQKVFFCPKIQVPEVDGFYQKQKDQLYSYITKFTANLKQIFRVKDIYVLLQQQETGYDTFYPADNKKALFIAKDHPMFKYFKATRDVLIAEEISYIRQANGEYLSDQFWRDLNILMREEKVSLITHLTAMDTTYGILFLGRREGDRAYSVEEIEELKKILGESTSYIWNSVMYLWAMLRTEKIALGRIDEIVTYGKAKK